MSTHTSADNALRMQPPTQHPFVTMLRTVFGQKPAGTGLQAGVNAVRPKKDPIQKLADKAGVLYWKWQELLEKDEDAVEAERQGNKKMGRPPVALSVLRQRAKDAYEAQIVELRQAEQAEGREPIPEDVLITKGEQLREKGPGRPAISEVGRKFRHLRRKLKTLEDAMAGVDEATSPEYDGLGRPAMSARERIAYYQRDIDAVKKDIDKALAEMPAEERLKVMLDNARIDRRDAGMRLKRVERGESNEDAVSLQGLLNGLEHEIQALERQLNDERQTKPRIQMGSSSMQAEVQRPIGKEYSPGLLAIIAQLESQLIVPPPPASLTPESLEKYKVDVALAQEFNATILSQIEALKAG